MRFLTLPVNNHVFLLYDLANICVFSDNRDATCLELLTRLFYPRGLGKNAVFIKKVEVSLVTNQ